MSVEITAATCSVGMTPNAEASEMVVCGLKNCWQDRAASVYVALTTLKKWALKAWEADAASELYLHHHEL